MRAGLLGALALACAPALAHAQAKRAAPTADPLRAVVFADQDAVIDLGPIVPTPGPKAAAPVAAASAPTPVSPTAAAPAARFTVTRISADGTRETRAIDADELKSLGRPPPPPPPPPRKPVGERAPAHVVAATPTLAKAPNWVVQGDTVAAATDAPRTRSAPIATLASQAGGKKKLDPQALVGVRDGRSYGEKGRFYLYAGMKDKGVGLNVVDHGEAWGGDGVSYDQGGFTGQRSAGLGWRKGDVSTSLGWVHDKNRINGLYGAPAEKDDRVAVTLSWRPSPAK